MNNRIVAPEVKGVEGMSSGYQALVEEAYIDPIRSVVVVDDEFPSLDSMLRRFIDDNDWTFADRDIAKTVSEILMFCRNRRRPWLVDVHDANHEVSKGTTIPHLHQCDLVILDYHLEGNAGGEKAVSLLRELARNHHFNMVVVYTKGDIRDVFWEIVAGLSFERFEFLDEDNRKRAEKTVREWQIHDEQLLSYLDGLVSPEIYLRERERKGYAASEMLDNLRAKLETAPPEIKMRPKELLDWLLQRQHSALLPAMSKEDFGTMTYTFNNIANWVRMKHVFVTVISKGTPPSEIEAGLLNALIKYRPSPHQLLMARMRYEMDERGVAAESAVLSDELLQAGWLGELCKAEHSDRKQLLRNTVERHWEALGDGLRVGIDEYAERLIRDLETRGEAAILAEYVPNRVSAQPDKILARLNSYYCTKNPVDHLHLTTGHIIRLSESRSAESYWVCLSPACDLVPEQKSSSSSSWHGRLEPFMPFIAVRIEMIKTGQAIEEATQNSYVFFPVEGEIKAFTFYPSADVGQNPAWEQMFALGQGRIEGDKLALGVCRISSSGSSLNASEPQMATVVTQLRYEYALNLLQRLGATLSRIGLDFKAKTREGSGGRTIGSKSQISTV